MNFLQLCLRCKGKQFGEGVRGRDTKKSIPFYFSKKEEAKNDPNLFLI